MDGILTDMRHAIASLRRQPMFLATAIATLAIGIGGTTAVFSVLKGVVFEPLPYHEPGQLVRLDCPAGNGYFSRPDFLDFREQADSLGSVASYIDYSLEGFDLTGEETARRVVAMPVSADYFATLGFNPFLGRFFTRQDERPETRQVIISNRLWQEHFSEDPEAIGSAVMLDREPWTVVAVLPTEFQEPFGRQIDVWPVDDLTPVENERQNYYLSVIGRLRPGTTIEAAQEEIDAIVSRIDAANPIRQPWQVRLEPLHDAVLGGSETLLFVLLGAMTIVLVIACVNVANLTLARSIARRRELAVRSALGGSRRRLARLMLAESVLVAVLGGLAGFGVARLAIGGLRVLRPAALPRLDAVVMDGRVLLFAVAISMITAVLFGLVPALKQSRSSVEDALRHAGRGSTAGIHNRRLRGALVVSEISLAFILVVGAALLAQSLNHLLEVDPGFSPEHVLTFQLSLPTSAYPVGDATRRIELDRQLNLQLAAMPGVSAAGAVSRLPLTGTYQSWAYSIRSEFEESGGDLWHLANTRVVSGDYFAALGVRLLRGRHFGDVDNLDTSRVAMVNRTLVDRRFGDTEALGQWVGNGEEWRQIVGVVEDERIGLREETPERIYYPYSQWANEGDWTMSWVVAGEGDVTPEMAVVRSVVKRLDPELVPFNEVRLEGVVATAVAREHFAMNLLTAIAAAALVLAVVGVYGVLSYSVAQRMPEIGLRLVLGADRQQVRGSVLREAVRMTVIALAVGTAGALLLTRWLESLVYGVGLSDPATFIFVGASLFLIAALTSLIPAERAVRADLSALLRSD